MFIGTPAAQLTRSFGHGCKTHSRGIGIGRDADAVVIDFDGKAVVRTAYPDLDPLCAGMFRRVADCLLTDAVRCDLDRRWKYREIIRDLEGNCRRAWLAHHSAEFGVLLKCRQQASMVEGRGSKSFHQAPKVRERGLLQIVQLP